MSEIRYYHGTKRSYDSPFAHEDKYTFWVYPRGSKPKGPWDTFRRATDYCNNHIDEGVAPVSPQLKQYVCLGHSKIEDMDVAKAEWKAHGLKAEVEWAVFPEIGVSGNGGCIHPISNTIAQQIHELEKGLEKSRVATNDLQRETAELKLFMNKANGSLNVLEVDDELKNQLTTQLAAENAELKSIMKDAIRRLDFLEQQLKKSTVEKATGPNVETVEKALPKTDDGNKFAYVYILPLLFALFVTLFTAKQPNPMLTTAHYPQITDNVD